MKFRLPFARYFKHALHIGLEPVAADSRLYRITFRNTGTLPLVDVRFPISTVLGPVSFGLKGERMPIDVWPMPAVRLSRLDPHQEASAVVEGYGVAADFVRDPEHLVEVTYSLEGDASGVRHNSLVGLPFTRRPALGQHATDNAAAFYIRKASPQILLTLFTGLTTWIGF